MQSSDNELHAYQAILDKRSRYEQLLQRHRQQGVDLQKAVVREKCRNQIMISNQHVQLRGDCVSKAQQLGLIRQSYVETSKNNQSDAQRLARKTLNNQTLANRVGELEDYVQIQKLRSLRLDKQLLAYQNYLDSMMERRNKVQEQIRIMNQADAGVKCPLKQKLMTRIISESNSNGRSIYQKDCENGQIYEFIRIQIINIKQMCSNINVLASILPLQYTKYQKLKAESQLSRQTFAHYSQNQEMQRQQDLFAHEDRIDNEISVLLTQIANQTAKEQHISSHCDQIARKQAISNAKQFALVKQKEVERKRKIVVGLLPLVASTDPAVMDEYRILQSQLSDLQVEEVIIKSTLLIEDGAN